MTAEIQPLFERLANVLSQERVISYQRSPKEPLETVLARYAWNVALCEALYVPLHFLEVALRNAIFKAIDQAYPITRGRGIDIDCWLDAKVPILSGYHIQLVNDAKRNILNKRPRKTITSGRLIAELHFGFWGGLFSHEYGYQGPDDKRFWPGLFPAVFPNLPPMLHKRSAIASRIRNIRQLRNRIFHHEPIWHKPSLRREYADIIEVLTWLEPNTAIVVNNLCRFMSIYNSGLTPYQHKLSVPEPPYSTITLSESPVCQDLIS